MQRPFSLKISVSGVRGVVGESLTPQLITSFAAAFGTYSGTGPILIGADTRPSGEMVKQAVTAGLLSVGCTPVDLGVVPLPALQWCIRALHAFGGIGISASHLPGEWNALKFLGPDGIVLRQNQSDELTDLYHQGLYPRVEAHEMAAARADDTALQRHRDGVLATVDVDSIRARRFKVAVDCCNGAGWKASPDFLRALGCEVIAINTDPLVPFARDPEPVAANLADIARAVVDSGAEIGFAQDADADRLALINERGEPLGEDCTIALVARHVLRGTPGPVVVNVSTSRMVDDVAAAHGCAVYRTAVGESNVVQGITQYRAVIGGEGNGGVIAPAANMCRDSFVGMALILEALAREGGSIAAMRDRIPRYAIAKDSLECPAREVAPSLRMLRHVYRDRQLDLTDGVKIIWPDRWLHARPSNTEPIIRVVAEAPTEDDAQALVRDVLECLCPSG